MKNAMVFITAALACGMLFSTGIAGGQVRINLGGGRDITAAELVSGRAVTGIRGDMGDFSMYYIDVPAGTTELTITSAGGSGDADMYVRHQRPPNRHAYDHRSIGSDTNETVRLENPAAGRYFVLLAGFRPYAGVSLRAVCAVPPRRGPRRPGVRVDPDRYEDDDRSSRAGTFRRRPQTHTIHTPDDVDWLAYTPFTAGPRRLVVSEADVPLKIAVYDAEDSSRVLAAFGTASFDETRNQTAAVSVASRKTKTYLVAVSSRRGRTGTYRIAFERIDTEDDVDTLPPGPPGHGRPGHGRPGGRPGPGLGDIRAETLSSGDKERNLEGDRGDRLYYRVYVPRGARVLHITLGDGEGNPDLYVAHNGVPTTRSHIHSATSGNRLSRTAEEIIIRSPQYGWYFILVHGRSDFEEVDLTAVVR